ncbi:hypothetical protein DLAC_04349 [Tieghemostelium lacteum]|uniref:Uncharacterized protein n=1 Tax=Tieghemostelium lacteum TaxID=361077 RepID=A0A151ZJ94_TIELA|nr:hypothetical protein DLAC_04349 [Tieghemostelium lacteum]|eukprot:KYQ94071.1 hypothetical protein DLAC_04349 [Tieghemostelium lacteum]
MSQKSESNTITQQQQQQPQVLNDTWQQCIETLYLIGYGIQDSMKLRYAINRVLQSETLKKNIIQCVLLNGILFLGTYLVYLFAITPMLTYLLHYFPTLTNMFSFIYFLLWVYPVYIFSLIANSKWYTEIAKEAFLRSGFQEDSNSNSNSNSTILSKTVDEIYRNLLFGVFLGLSVVIAFIPYTNTLNFILLTWLYSFWCFDYKWILRGKWNLLQRLKYFESHWAYMFGYGFLFNLTSFFFPTLIGNGIFALLYPLFIILAVSAKPRKLENRRGLLPKQIPIFVIPEFFVNVILKRFVIQKASNSYSSNK